MEINKIELKYTHKNGFTSDTVDGDCHIKTLPYLSVVQSVEGDYDIKIGDEKTYNTGRGGFFIAPSDVRQTITHNADKISKKMTCRWVFLKIVINERYDFEELYSLPLIIPETFKNEMNKVFDMIFETDNPFDEHVCYYKIVKLLSEFAENKERIISKTVKYALDYIKNNYNKKISVSNIAKEVGLSESHLYSVFKKETGVSPIAYLNNYRLSTAADLLIKNNMTVSEIADIVGVFDSVYFNKLFRKYHNMSPSKYRDIFRND